MTQQEENGYTRGVAYCTAMFLKYWGEHPAIEEWWKAAGMSIELCKKEEVDSYDMETLLEYEQYLDKQK